MARKKSIHYVNNAEFSQAVVDYVTIADEAKKEQKEVHKLFPKRVLSKNNFNALFINWKTFMNSNENCSMFLTFHKIKNKAICHYCSYEKKILNKCKAKGLCDFIMYGPGVEKIFEEVKDIFPTKNIRIFSSDYMKKK